MPPKVVRNEQIDRLAKNHCYEIVIFPAYLPDSVCMQQLRTNPDPNVIYYIAMMKGITPIVTIAGHKAFVVTLEEPKKPNRSLPKFHSPSYSNREKEEKHLQDRRNLH